MISGGVVARRGRRLSAYLSAINPSRSGAALTASLAAGVADEVEPSFA